MKYHFKCRVCGYDDEERGELATEDEKDCPLCFSDCFQLVPLDRWPEGEKKGTNDIR